MGANPDAIRWFDRPGAALLPYASLLNARDQRGSPLKAVVAVYEWQALPLIFIVDGQELGTDRNRLSALRTLLSLRGDAPYLGVLFAGRLDVYILALGGTPARNRVDLSLREVEKKQTFAKLANIRPSVGARQRGWVSDVVLRLLTKSIDDLAATGLHQNDAISLVGRALFARFLVDRSLLAGPEVGLEDPAHLFDTPAQIGATNRWLDKTFNGDLLPVDRKIVAGLKVEQCFVLGNILRKAPNGEYLLGWKERWDNLDFAHIPVGVLSQAYEQHLMVHAKKRRKREGGFYTPTQIAQLIVSATLRAVDREKPNRQPRLLDPAVGAGVFLIIAFRELIARQWLLTGRRPTTKQIRTILYTQLVGFDVNEAALRFTALGLYLAAIELDPDPRPVGKLVFENLRDRVLFRVGDPDDDTAPDLGSLGPRVGSEHDGAYDIVLGNPPWSSGTRLPEWQSVVEMVAEVARERLPDQPSPPLPNEVLDLPFVWRAMRWARPDGQIAFALHGRLLFQQAEGMDRARAALFSCLDVTSIINGADLRQTKVWPSVSAPFCMLFARNQPPPKAHSFRFLSPKIERDLNDAGVMRVDAVHSDIVSTTDVSSRPYIFKSLYRGSNADLSILDRLLNTDTTTLSEYWSGNGHSHGNGYQMLRPSSRYRKVDGVDADRPGVDASYLHDLREFPIAQSISVLVDAKKLPKFRIERIHDRRPHELFEGPLLLIKKTPPAEHQRISLTIVDGDAVFNETFYGYSAANMVDGSLLPYLVVMLGSRIAMWLALVTSGEFGVERDVIEKTTIDAIPLPRWERVSASDRKKVATIFDGLKEGSTAALNQADRLAQKLYGLTDRDREVIEDTLAFNLPYARTKLNAQAAVRPQDIEKFRSILDEELRPLEQRFKVKVGTFTVGVERNAVWQAIGIHLTRRKADVPRTIPNFEQLLDVADNLAATEITLEVGDHSLVIARLNQRRYWTRTQARLAAQQLFWSHIPALMERAS